VPDAAEVFAGQDRLTEVVARLRDRVDGEIGLMPRLRAAPREAVALADGFSCRTRIEEHDSCGHHPIHLAQLLARGLGQPSHHQLEGASR